ncbi:MAG: LemA family protein, partial [Chloroflexi bacterium]|nr:LemA family protein [Chloroflexota bacterium]
ALARDYFNDIATFYNTRLEIVPDRFVAGLVRLRPAALMSAADFERAPVQVKLAS